MPRLVQVFCIHGLLLGALFVAIAILPKSAAVSADLSQLTAIVTSTGPSKSITRLLKSLQRYGPGLKVLIASAEEQEYDGATVVKCDPKQGVHAARNALLARVQTPHFLLLDDQLELTRRSQIERLLGPVAEGNFDLVAGELVACRKKLLFLTNRELYSQQATLQIDFDSAGDVVTMVAGSYGEESGLQRCDATSQFYVARTDKLRAMGGWSQGSEFDQREVFFIRAKRFGLQAAACPNVTAQAWWSSFGSSAAGELATTAALGEIGVARLTTTDGKSLVVAQTQAELAA